MGWVGSRWLSPKASAGVAGGERVCMWWGWEEGVCVCVCVRVGGVCVRVCVFSAWKDGWRGTSAEELLLVTARETRKRNRDRREGGTEEETDPTQTDGERRYLSLPGWLLF